MFLGCMQAPSPGTDRCLPTPRSHRTVAAGSPSSACPPGRTPRCTSRRRKSARRTLRRSPTAHPRSAAACCPSTSCRRQSTLDCLRRRRRLRRCRPYRRRPVLRCRLHHRKRRLHFRPLLRRPCPRWSRCHRRLPGRSTPPRAPPAQRIRQQRTSQARRQPSLPLRVPAPSPPWRQSVVLRRSECQESRVASFANAMRAIRRSAAARRVPGHVATSSGPNAGFECPDASSAGLSGPPPVCTLGFEFQLSSKVSTPSGSKFDSPGRPARRRPTLCDIQAPREIRCRTAPHPAHALPTVPLAPLSFARTTRTRSHTCA